MSPLIPFTKYAAYIMQPSEWPPSGAQKYTHHGGIEIEHATLKSAHMAREALGDVTYAGTSVSKNKGELIGRVPP